MLYFEFAEPKVFINFMQIKNSTFNLHDFMEYIPRKMTSAIERGAKYFPVVVLTGPRQSGKSTLCKHVFSEYSRYNLEDLGLRENIAHDPKGFIDNCDEHVVIDEVQHLPELFSYIQLAVDENPGRRFILTGSSNFALMESITQSLAGRAALYTLLPLALDEVGEYRDSSTETLLFNGLYPSVVTASRPADLFYPNYYSTYIERDVRQLKNITDISAFQTFVRLLAGRCGTEFNASGLSVEVGVSAPTIKSWMSVLQTSYIAFLLPPYFVNLNKRLTKTPKVYFYDTGILCYLLGLEEPYQLATHPLRGSVFENLAVNELLKKRYNAGKLPNLTFYRENSGREADIVMESPAGLDLIEVKMSKSWNKGFVKNLDYLKNLLGDQVAHTSVVYDGETILPNTFNVRDLTEYI